LRTRWKAAFIQAARDNIAVLALNFSTDVIDIVGGIDPFIRILKEYHKEYFPNAAFLPELTFDRGCDVDIESERLEDILAHNFFKSVDISCDEFAQPIKNFKGIFRKAKCSSLRLKAHVGEYGTADDVMEAVEELGLDEVHHGIAVAKSPQIMRWLARHKVQLNVCPTSNLMLGLVDGYNRHPIRELYDAGIPVTVNTDDMLIFNSSVSQEYMKLFDSGLMTAEELNDIRITGLKERHASL